MRVLTVVPTYPGGMVRERTRAAVEAALGDDTPLYIDAEPDGPAKHYDSLLFKLAIAREMTLAQDYDALWLVEADVIVPPDALDRLTAADADIAYGLYCGRLEGVWLCLPVLDANGGPSLSATPERARALWGTVIESGGLHTGCTLIRRRVLEAIEFRCPDVRKRWAPDFYLAQDAQKAGFRQVHDLGVVCGHEVKPGVVYWPDPDAANLYRIEGETMPRKTTGKPTSGTYTVLRRLYSSALAEYIQPGGTIELTDPDTVAILLEKQAIAAVVTETEQPVIPAIDKES